MSQIISKLNDGGPFFMYTMVIILIIILALFIVELVKKDNNEKTIEYIKSLSWFTAAWGLLGHSIGLITAFDAIQAAGDVAPPILAAGLKIALLTPTLASFVFIVGRILILILIALRKKD